MSTALHWNLLFKGQVTLSPHCFDFVLVLWEKEPSRGGYWILDKIISPKLHISSTQIHACLMRECRAVHKPGLSVSKFKPVLTQRISDTQAELQSMEGNPSELGREASSVSDADTAIDLGARPQML